MYRLNERLSSTADGVRLLEIAEYKELLADMKADKAEYKAAMTRKNRIIRSLGIGLGIFVLLALALLLTDVLTNHTGWFRL